MTDEAKTMEEGTDVLADTLVEGGVCKCARKVREVTGGIINKASLYDTNSGPVFVKHSTRDNALSMFTSERESLHLLKHMDVIRVPSPGPEPAPLPDGGAVFTMEWIEGLEPVTTQWAELGTRIARMHRYNADKLAEGAKNAQTITSPRHTGLLGQEVEGYLPVDKFGFHVTQFVGPTFEVQSGWHDSWPTGDREMVEVWSEVQLHIHKAFRDITITPAVTHGDFCTINVAQTKSQPVLFDPGCSFSHSETDFIIPAMEGNFPPEFYSAYYSVLPKEAGADTRIKLYLFYANSLVFNMVDSDFDQWLENSKKCGRNYLQAIAESSH